MSAYNTIDILCRQCGDEFRGTIWTAVHAGQDPELKELLLGGELNMIRCPSCGDITYQEHFVLYQEPAAELVAYVYPEGDRKGEDDLRKIMLKSFQEAQAVFPEKDRLKYEPLLFIGLEAFVEQLIEEEARAEQSQIAQVLARQNNLETVLLHPTQARRLKTMRVLPRIGKGNPPTRAQVLEGLDKLLELNPMLDRYAALRQDIQMQPGWRI